jgi:NADH:ubiquinone oxidoreductase subunit F (NADH-binding)/NAD-dependent dihydropyrimidine dehydrogenase PreA subunit/(2Fe-2S) ferredoxin
VSGNAPACGRERGPAVGGRTRLTVKVCAGAGCTASGSPEVVEAFRRAIDRVPLLDAHVEEVGSSAALEVGITGCHGFCAMGVLVAIPELGILYCRVGARDVDEIVRTSLARRRPIERLLFKDPTDGSPCRGENEIPFFGKQVREALANCGEVDPEDIDDYRSRGGYESLAKALREMRPAQVIDELKRSGLQGRGGAGFPTGLKWQLVAEAEGHAKCVVCNGDEGDPGAFTDRSILAGDPHAVIEGMCIAAYAVGAQKGILYVRAAYRLAIHRLTIALEQARARTCLGRGVLGTGFDFDISIVEGAGAFVCGEETALLSSIEGRRGMPRPRPPYPAIRGLWGCPTLINNVETYANVPRVIAKGARVFAGIGTEASKGTKTFALTGQVNNVGLVEVPMGITLREIVFDIGGGIPEGKRFKAAQIGGSAGGCIPAAHLDTPIDYRSLQELGATMGSGGLVVLDESTCMVKLAKYFLEFCVEESCGKCPPCRIGNQVMVNILDRIIEGEGRPDDVERLAALGEHIRRTSLCGLGQTAPNPTLSAIRHFRAEYEAHIHERRCPAGECPKLVTFYIDEARCDGCELCVASCPVGAISGEAEHVHAIDANVCVHCGACLPACPSGAVRTK